MTFQSVKLDLKVWVGSNEGWVDGGGLVRTRMRDGSVRKRDGLEKDEDKGWVAEWLACDGGAVCRGVVLGITDEDGFEQGWVSLTRMCLGSSGGVCLSFLSSGVYFLEIRSR